MFRVRPHRRAVLAVTVLATALPVVSPAPTWSAARGGRHVQSHVRVTAAYELPGRQVYPEGITADPHTGDLYTGSYVDGAIFKLTPGHRVATQILPPGAEGRGRALGLKVDQASRLWVVDADTGVAVYDLRSRRLVARFDVAGQEPRLVNDLAIAPDGSVYLTDSLRAVVYRVTPRQFAGAREHGGRAPLTPAFDLSSIVRQQPPGTVTLNGIVADRSGRYLLVVDMTGGDLYRIDLRSGGIRKVALDGGELRYADGLELQDDRLWVAHADPAANAISRWRITGDGRAARAERRVTDQALQLPTTLVHSSGRLFVVRSQFDRGGPVGPGVPQIPFTIATVHGI